ncbi:MAG: hypothetical protein NTU94_02905 [Planctomycetota bacterium]|nr:hypothetical protein [Planctomycetota bacterium]
MSFYSHFCRSVEPVAGAPLLPPGQVDIEASVRRYHFSLVDAWWQKHKDDFQFRRGAPLQPETLHQTIPSRPKDWTPVLSSLRRAATEHAGQPR